MTNSERSSSPSRFKTDALVTILGSGGAQILNVLAIPVLSRLYSPDQFGIWATYSAFVAIFASVVILRLDIAVVTAKTHRLASHILIGAALISIFVVAGGSALVFGVFFGLVDRVDSEKFHWIVWLPFGILGTAFCTLSTSWWVRLHRFRMVTAIRIGQSLFNILFQLIMFWISPETGLVAGNTLGLIFLSIVVSAFALPSLTWPNSNLFYVRSIAAIRRFKNLALFTTPYTLQSQFFRQLPVVLLSSLISSEAAGLYAIGQRFVYNPLALLADALQQPIYPRLAAEPTAPAVHNLISNVLKKFGVVLGVGCALATVFAHPAIVFVLGEKWSAATPFVVATCYAAASLVATSWLVRIFDIFGRQRLHLIFDFVGNIIVISLFASVLLITHNSVWSVLVLSAATAIYYAAWAVVAFRVARMQQQILVKTLQYALVSWLLTMALGLLISRELSIGLLSPEG